MCEEFCFLDLQGAYGGSAPSVSGGLLLCRCCLFVCVLRACLASEALGKTPLTVAATAISRCARHTPLKTYIADDEHTKNGRRGLTRGGGPAQFRLPSLRYKAVRPTYVSMCVCAVSVCCACERAGLRHFLVCAAEGNRGKISPSKQRRSVLSELITLITKRTHRHGPCRGAQPCL